MWMDQGSDYSRADRQAEAPPAWIMAIMNQHPSSIIITIYYYIYIYNDDNNKTNNNIIIYCITIIIRNIITQIKTIASDNNKNNNTFYCYHPQLIKIYEGLSVTVTHLIIWNQHFSPNCFFRLDVELLPAMWQACPCSSEEGPRRAWGLANLVGPIGPKSDPIGWSLRSQLEVERKRKPCSSMWTWLQRHLRTARSRVCSNEKDVFILSGRRKDCGDEITMMMMTLMMMMMMMMMMMLTTTTTTMMMIFFICRCFFESLGRTLHKGFWIVPVAGRWCRGALYATAAECEALRTGAEWRDVETAKRSGRR